MTLSEFLTARLDEEQVAAQRAYDDASDYRVVGSYLVEDHFARWKPDRVLADVDAKRRIVTECLYYVNADHDVGVADLLGKITLEFLALPYADHPDYLEEWKP